jgi:hypothetical protein
LKSIGAPPTDVFTTALLDYATARKRIKWKTGVQR